MTTPEETRERIKKMRERIFKEPDKDTLENSVEETPQEKKLTEEKSQIQQNNEISSVRVKPTNLQEKLKQNDDRISLLVADTQKQISKIVFDFTNKNSNLETQMLDKIENTFVESSSKIDGLEQLINDNFLTSSQASKAFREELNELSRSVQLDINSVLEKSSAANHKIETELQNSTDNVLKFENSVEELKTSLEKSFSKKIQQNDDQISLLSANTQRQISEIALKFTDESSSLETSFLDKLENTFDESSSKIKGIEQLLNDNSLTYSQANKALKERLDELTRSLQLDINSVLEKSSAANHEIETELQNHADQLLNFENSVEERQSSLEESFHERLQQNGDRVSFLSADTQRQISEIAREFADKSSSLETSILDKLDIIFAESSSKTDGIEQLVNDNFLTSSQANKTLKWQLNEISRSIQLDISSVAKRFSSANQKIETELQNQADQLSNFENSVEEQQNSLEQKNNFLEDSFSEKIQQNGDRISLLSVDTQRQISEIIRKFTDESSSLKTTILDKLENTFTESSSKIDNIEQLVNDNSSSYHQNNKALLDKLENTFTESSSKIDNIEQLVNINKLTSSQENKAFKDRLDELNRSTQLNNNSIVKRISSANQQIETALLNNANKLQKFENSVAERQDSLEVSFFEKLQQNNDNISLLSADTQKKISGITQEFESKISSLEPIILDKIERISFHLKKVEEQNDNQINDFSMSLQKYVSSITASQDDKINAQAMKIQSSVKSLKKEIFDNQRDLQADFYKKIKESEVKTIDYFSKKIVEVRELLSEEVKLLSEEVANLNDVVKEKHSEFSIHVENSVSTFTKTSEKDRKYFNNRFEKVSDTIQLLESKIVKEEELTELFQNYTLNVNISDDAESSKD